MATSDGTFKPISDFALKTDIPQIDTSDVNSVDITDIETADITKLRTIVRNLIDALNTSGLIRTNSNIE